ncbi:MAG TPA: AMP-binding protein [Actinocrinis sp.]
MRAGGVPWPEAEAAAYRAAGYWRDEPLGVLAWRWADRYGERTAVVDGEVRLSYRELAERSDALAEQLQGFGLGCGATVMVQLPNCWEFVVLFLACVRVGAVPLFTLMPLRDRELGQLAALAGADAIVVRDTWYGYDHRALARRVAAGAGRPTSVIVLGGAPAPGEADLSAMIGAGGDPRARSNRLDRVPVDPADVALFLLSGGTTGVPKIIARTHNDYEYNARQSGAVCEFDDKTVYIAVLPIAHNFAFGSPGLLATLMSGGRVVLARSPEPGRAFELIDRESATVTSVVPAVLRRWLDTALELRWRPRTLRCVQVGGSILPPELAARVTPVLGCALQQVFGMAEGLLNYTRPDDPAQVRETTQGRPISPGDEIRVVDERGDEVAPGRVGELLTRGPYTPRGYFAAPEHNAGVFAGGWYRSGDLVRVHPSGNLVVVGRSKDLINSSGEKISAREVEDLLRELGQVADAAAVPVRDELAGERVGACVILKPGTELTRDQVHEQFERRGVARFKFPDRLLVLPAFPLTAVGKVDKTALSTLIAARRAETGGRR